MKKYWVYLVLIAALTGCKGKVKTEENSGKESDSSTAKMIVDPTKQVVDTILLNKTDTAFVVKNKMIKDDIGDKQKQYIIQIFFTNEHWPVLIYKNAIGADLALAGDLNGDNQPEILLRPEWFSSCWSSVNLFSLRNNEWKLIKKGSMYFCSDKYPLPKRVVKTDKGYGLLTDSLTDDKFITLKKEIKF
ncbi:hypothetical protein [Pedobacter boryungensis]|uniref:VCBS repeat-containing protein n=1 Tax=Pedobacter boryungensis TaxID=869962 RepID=A0ABX2DEI2_9SPHI|nr:hypothetical protein [Pedobacter boryungensis]NQX32508.1 hypothetical protein [Pedobacter boryungensis]